MNTPATILDDARARADGHHRPGVVDLLPAAQSASESRIAAGGGQLLPIVHTGRESQSRCGDGELLDDAQSTLESQSTTGVVDLLPAAQPGLESHTSFGGGQLLPIVHVQSESQGARGDGELLDDAHRRNESQATSGVVDLLPAAQSRYESHAQLGGGQGWLELRIWAEMLHDQQESRKAAANRATRGGVDADIYAAHLDNLTRAEHECYLTLVRCYRRVVPPSIREWAKAQPGIGDRLLARLLGHIGHPAIASPHAWVTDPATSHECSNRCGKGRHLVAYEPHLRSLRQLWAYCGHGDPTRKRAKGMTAEDAMAMGSPFTKSLVYLLAESAMKEPGRDIKALLAGEQELGAKRPYRHIYEARRLATVDREWTDGHKNADALRLTGKEILRGLWVAARADLEIA